MNVVRVVVAGGGITGLVAAFTLQQEAARRRMPIEVSVLEADAAPGGHAQTIVEDGFIVERGPNGFLDRGEATVALIDELGLRPRVIEANPAARRRFILRDGRLRHVPESPPALIASDALGWRGKWRLLQEPWAPAAPIDRDESVFEFAERRLGREAAETFVDTAVAGISAGDSRLLSVKSQFPVLKEWERVHGSLLKAMLARRRSGASRPKLLSLDRGLGILTTTLVSRLNGAVRINAPIARIVRAGNSWKVHLRDGAVTTADHVLFALPAHAAAGVSASFDAELSDALNAIPYAGLTVVALAYPAPSITRPLDGYGYLVKRSEDLATLGVLWESTIFPDRAPAGTALLRVMLGGARRSEVSTFGEEAVTDIAVAEATRVLRISGRPVRQWVWRWPSAIAQYNIGHEVRVSTIRRLVDRHRGLHLCGTAYDGVSFNDAIASARRTAVSIVEELAA